MEAWILTRSVEPPSRARWIFEEYAVENSCERHFHDQSERVHYANKCINRFAFIQRNERLAVLHRLERRRATNGSQFDRKSTEKNWSRRCLTKVNFFTADLPSLPKRTNRRTAVLQARAQAYSPVRRRWWTIQPRLRCPRDYGGRATGRRSGQTYRVRNAPSSLRLHRTITVESPTAVQEASIA